MRFSCDISRSGSRNFRTVALSLSSLFLLQHPSFGIQDSSQFTSRLEAENPRPTRQLVSPTDPEQQPKSFIEADNASYHIHWDGKSGSLTTRSIDNQTETVDDLILLQNDPGPTGFSKRLAWFVSRNRSKFTILWCYLDDAGSEFACWLYRYPENRLTPLKFKGAYAYSQNDRATQSESSVAFEESNPPEYSGTEFKFQNWNRKSGKIETLDLTPAQPNASSAKISKALVSKKIENLSVFPLHKVDVGAKNGWKDDGWAELHAIAFDDHKDPFYLILYTNTSQGYAIDLKNGVSYSTDFGDKVQFIKPAYPLLPEKQSVEELQKVMKTEMLELTFEAKNSYANPYKEAQATLTLKSPDGKTILAPAFWDGGNVWKVRFAPVKVGTWSFQSHSKDPGLDGKIGRFECVENASGKKNFVSVAPSYLDPRHFISAKTEPYFPIAIQGSLTEGLAVSSKGAKNSAGLKEFKEKIDRLSSMGVNRISGGFLLNESSPNRCDLTDDALSILNTDRFQELDRRVEYCNEKGITPDFGLGALGDRSFKEFGAESVFRFWGYVVSRYSAYDVFWNLFERDELPLSLQTRKQLNELAELTRLYDSHHHPISTITPGAHGVVLDEKGNEEQGAVPNFAPWQSYIAFRGGDLSALSAFQKEGKPVVVFEPLSAEGGDPEVGRRRMWRTRMSGAYWVGGDLTSLESAKRMAQFFAETRFARLSPHPEMLGGDFESATDRKRRRRAEAEILKAKAVKSGVSNSSGDDSSKSVTPVEEGVPEIKKQTSLYILADPGREYVVYFEHGGSVLLDLLEATGRIKVSWFNPKTGVSSPVNQIYGGKFLDFVAPDENDWVLHLNRR